MTLLEVLQNNRVKNILTGNEYWKNHNGEIRVKNNDFADIICNNEELTLLNSEFNNNWKII